MENPKISIIVPVYNAERYLRRCVDSILTQTFSDFEVLLIDDGSKDHSGAICDEYAQQDDRVRVWHKENGGVSSARNVGLDNAQGEWVTFVDSDDWIDKDYLENFSMDYDICVQNYYYGDDIMQSPDKVVTEKPGEDYLIHEYVFGPYCKVFKSKIISEHLIRFDSRLAYGEDVLFWLQYLCYCKNMKVTSYVGYHYVLYGSNTLSCATKSFEQSYHMFQMHVKYMEILLEKSSYRQKVLRKEIFNMFYGFIVGHDLKFSQIKSNSFFYRCFRQYLNIIDKMMVVLLPKCINYYRRFLIKFHLL